MSKQSAREKTENPSKTSQRDLEADFLLNKHVFRTCAYSVAGFGVGLAASLLFFKHKATMSVFFAGTGAGYGIAGFTNDLSNYQRYRSWAHNQSQRPQRTGGDARQGMRDFDGFVFSQYAQSQKGQERSNQQKEGRDKLSHQRDDQGENRSTQHKDSQRNDRSSHSNSNNQGQQRHESSNSEKHDTQQGKQSSQSQQSQHNKQQTQGKEQPLNPEAKQKQDIANQKQENQQGKQDHKAGHGPSQVKPTTQDKGKRLEEATYSQSIQGGQEGTDDHQRGEKAAQNSQIPPSQKDYTGGHASQGVHQGQVHRGSPDSDKMGKSPAPTGTPNKQNEKENKGQPAKQENQALQNKVDLKGQNLQTFQSNPLPLGKAGLTHEIKTDYQEGRNRANDPDLDNTRRQQAGLEQDRLGQSVKEGNNIKVRESSDTRAGVGNYQPGVATQNNKNQVNAIIE